MSAPRVIVVGAGVIGVWSAWHLRQRGADVVLVDAWGAANSRSTSGDETRILRAAYGGLTHYIDLTLASIPQWESLPEVGAPPIFRRCGALWLFDAEDSFVTASLPHLKQRGIEIKKLEATEAVRRFPQVYWDDVITAYHEPDAGFVLARRSVEAVVRRLESAGTPLRLGYVTLQQSRATAGCAGVKLADGTTLEADVYVFACGPWMRSLFPEAIGPLLRPTRQEVFYFGAPAGDRSFAAGSLPAWIDGAKGSWYGVPGNENRGFKISSNELGEVIDPTTLERKPDANRLDRARAHLAHRFPRLAGAPLLESRVCQYELTPDRGLIVDRLPADPRVVLVGGGSGHAFKLAPALGELVSRTVLENRPIDATYGLARFAGLDPNDDRNWHMDLRKP